MTFVGGAGDDVLEDFWNNEINAHRRLAYHWVGETCFKLKDDANMEGDDVDTQGVHALDGMEHAHLMEHDVRAQHVHPMASPPKPSPEDRAEHKVHHATYAAWCPHSVRIVKLDKAEASPHQDQC